MPYDIFIRKMTMILYFKENLKMNEYEIAFIMDSYPEIIRIYMEVLLIENAPFMEILKERV